MHFLKPILYMQVLACLVTLAISFKLDAPLAADHQATKPQNIEITPEFLRDLRATSSCNEVLDAPSSGVIHRPFEPVPENERCAWILGVPGAVGYNINILYLGNTTNQNGTGHELTFTGSAPYNNKERLYSYQPTDAGSFRIPSANLVIVTFTSGQQNVASNAGFVFQYEAVFSGSVSKSSPDSVHLIFNHGAYESKYPQEAASYANYEASSFLFVPPNGVATDFAKNIYYKRMALEGTSCYDSLYVYRFNANAVAGTNKWEYSNRICGNVTTQNILFDDMALLLFSTDGSITGSGFNITYIGC